MLEVSGIDVYYGEVQAIWDLSFEVREGEIVTLIGSNGAGKSTTLKAVTGLLHPRRGTITFLDERIDREEPYNVVSRGISLVPEGRQLWPGMTVLENLEMGAYASQARRVREQSLKRVFDLFPRLHERRYQKAGTLSGGEQQMCAIGRGLMSRPKLLAFDEPSLGLAPKLVADVFRVIQEIKRLGVTVLLVEQNVHYALEVSDRAYVLETGRIGMSGTGAGLLQDPRVQAAYLGVS